jgi:hypothetical protein
MLFALVIALRTKTPALRHAFLRPNFMGVLRKRFRQVVNLGAEFDV